MPVRGGRHRKRSCLTLPRVLKKEKKAKWSLGLKQNKSSKSPYGEAGVGTGLRAVPSFELAISQAIYHSKWLLGRFLGLMKGIEGQATETAA
jgi:hypothetical protein